MNNLIDLHLHLDGSLSLESVKSLAELQNISLPSDGEILKKLKVSDDCKNLNEYLEKFDFPLTLLQTKEAVSMAVCNLKKELKSQGVVYAEIRFAPQLHLQKGLSQADVVEAALDGMRKCDMNSNLILCCMRGKGNEPENFETVDVAEKFLGKGVCAVDLAGAEAVFKTKNYENLFKYAGEKGLPFTIHAGEADGPDSVWKALEYGAKRIGHGVRSTEDSLLVKYLSEKEIPLELCPTSNLNTAVFSDLRDYPILKLMEAGVKVTVNTDNLSVSNTTIEKEFRKLIRAFNLSDAQIKTLQKNAVEAAFLDENSKKNFF